MSAKKMAVTVAVVCVFVMAIFLIKPGISTNAQAPAGTRTLPYNGQLTYSGENAVDGAYDFIFNLYDAPEAGNLLWSEQQAGIAVMDGKFSTDLGVATPFPTSLFESQDIWLEVSLRGPGEADFTTLTPRQDFTPLAADALTCPHTHYGASWSGTGAIDAMYLNNSSSGAYDGLHVESYNTDPYHGAVYARNVASTGNGDAINTRSARGAGLRADSGADNGIDATTSALLASNKSAIYAHSTNGNGVWAISTNRMGVYGNSQYGSGVTGVSSYSYGLVATGGGDSNPDDSTGDIYVGGNRGEIFSFGSVLELYSNAFITLDLDEDNNSANQLEVYNGAESLVFTVNENGNTWAAGTKSALVKTDAYGQRLLYSVESPEVRFEDFGSATLLKGIITIEFDPIFAQTVNTELDYQVFLTPVCVDFVLLKVSAKTTTGFTVEGITLNNEPSSCAFDYRIVAKRLGYENIRLEQVDPNANSRGGVSP